MKALRYGSGVGFDLFGDATRQLVDVADVVEGDLHGRLQSAAQHVDQLVVVHAVFQHVMSRMDVGRQLFLLGHPVEALRVDDAVGLSQQGFHLFVVRSSGDEEFRFVSFCGLHIGRHDGAERPVAEGNGKNQQDDKHEPNGTLGAFAVFLAAALA